MSSTTNISNRNNNKGNNNDGTISMSMSMMNDGELQRKTEELRGKGDATQEPRKDTSQEENAVHEGIKIAELKREKSERMEARLAEASSFIIGTYNIHGWKDKQKKPSAIRILETIKKAKVHIIGLNEVFHSNLPQLDSEEGILLRHRLSSSLDGTTCTQQQQPHVEEGFSPEKTNVDGSGGKEREDIERTGTLLDAIARKSCLIHYIFGAAMQNLEYGNALLSQFPMKSHSTFVLKSPSYPNEETRNIIIAEYDYRTAGAIVTPFAVCVTHLDPRYEKARLEQLETAMQHIRETIGEDMPHLILGDFNAVRKEDYTEEFWAEMAELRRRAGLEEPRTEVVEFMERHGYVDTWQLCGENREELRKKNKVASCWVGTKIDFIWASRTLMHHYDLLWSRFVESDASDHIPVTLAIRPKESPASA